jgi:hypothetical protein
MSTPLSSVLRECGIPGMSLTAMAPEIADLLVVNPGVCKSYREAKWREIWYGAPVTVIFTTSRALTMDICYPSITSTS